MISRLTLALFGMLAAIGVIAPAAPAHAQTDVSIAVLKYGTVNWVMDVIEHNKLDEKHGIKLRQVPLASGQATAVALQAGEVDLMVTDWLWVSRQRADGSDVTFSPYSTALGALMVPADSRAKTLADLKGKSIGVAGGPLDKSWLLINAVAIRKSGTDLRTATQPAYGAPPLLAEKAKSGELDSVLNYWHYAARLEAAGFRRLYDVETAVKALGAKGPVAMVGYCFRQGWAESHPNAARGFLQAARDAMQLLKTSDAEWERIRPLMKTANDAEFKALKKRFRDGIPERTASAERDDAALLYEILYKLGGERLVGKGKQLAPGTFWMGDGS